MLGCHSTQYRRPRRFRYGIFIGFLWNFVRLVVHRSALGEFHERWSPQGVVKRFDGSFDEYDSPIVTKTRTSGSQARFYLRGLMQARRRNIERIGDPVPGSDEQALHHFIANSPWNHRPVLDKVARRERVAGRHEDSFLVIDETGFPKKGRDSVGVARQWCGRLGKVDKCQTARELRLAQITREALDLATALVAGAGVPKKANEDALHIATAATNGLDYLLTWNCTHIANAVTIPRVSAICRSYGFEPPLIYTPQEFMEGRIMDDPIVEETREARRQLDAEFGGDLESLYAYFREIERQNAHRVVKLKPKSPAVVDRKIS